LEEKINLTDPAWEGLKKDLLGGARLSTIREEMEEILAIASRVEEGPTVSHKKNR